VKLLLALATPSISGVTALEVHYLDFFSLLDMFTSGAPSYTKSGVGISMYKLRMLRRSLKINLSRLSRRAGYYELGSSLVTALY
jgi:hypothetical protein